jgi:3'(2'), 5'-bisphosphate nucleotidase
MDNRLTLISTAIAASVWAGREIMKIYNDPAADFFVERKADSVTPGIQYPTTDEKLNDAGGTNPDESGSPLTIADKTAHKIIVQHLEKTGIPVLSEEGKTIPYQIRKSWKTFWLVDPLDGTKEFIKRNGEFTVNIALINDNKPVAGVIYVPVTETLYAASVAEGAWKTFKPDAAITWEILKETGTKLPAVSLPETYTLVGSRSHRNAETEEYMAQRKKEYGQVEMISQGSSLKICLVAEGAAHEYPRLGPTMEWDTAAGHAIANAAGKKLWLTDFSGELIYNKENLLNPFFIVK